MNDSGDVAFSFQLMPAHPPELRGFEKSGLFRYSHANQKVSAVVIPGITIAPGFGVFLASGENPTLNRPGDIVFPAVVRTAPGLTPTNDVGQGIFLIDHNGQVTKVVAPGDPVPGGGKFDFFQNPWINDKGDIAFGGHVAGEECFTIGIVGCAESIYLKTVGSEIRSIAHQGEQAPAAGKYLYACGPELNNRGDLIFMGELTPRPGVTKARGIYLHSSSVTVPIALPGDVMPDGRRFVMVKPSRQEMEAAQINIVFNWFEELNNLIERMEDFFEDDEDENPLSGYYSNN